MGVKLVCGRNKNICNDQVIVAAKNIKAKCFACELWVMRVGTFGWDTISQSMNHFHFPFC